LRPAAHAADITKEVTPTMNPYTIDYSYFQLHNVKFEQTDLVSEQYHITG
jgi:hypothetical protein